MSVWRARRGRGIGEALELSESCIIAACGWCGTVGHWRAAEAVWDHSGGGSREAAALL